MPGPSLCGLLSQAPLLPKLRGHFAEFLDNTSSAGLRILSSSTCVGLRYGPVLDNSGFSRRPVRTLRYSLVRSASRLLLPHTDLLHAASCACAGSFLFRPVLPFRVPTVLPVRGAGISTCCPSATPLSLALGPDFPREDQLYPGNLGYSAWMIHTSISLLIPAFSLPARPLLLPVQLRPCRNAPLPMYL